MLAEMVNEQALFCPRCKQALPDALFNRGAFAPCPNCGTQVRCEVFPALHSGPKIGRAGELLVDTTDASCFFHAEKKAVVACETCGRFLCSLCDLDFAGRHICPNCLTAGRKKGALGNLDYSRFSWNGLALFLVTVPLVIWPLTLATAPAAIVVAIIGLRKPPSLTGRRRILSLVFAMIFAVVEIVGWLWLFHKFFGSKIGG